MIHLPNGKIRQEILATPHLVRLTKATGDKQIELTLIIRCDTLRLKYLFQQPNFSFSFIVVNKILCYALLIEDGGAVPIIIWSAVQSQDELSSFYRILIDRRVVVHLYNEACVQVALTVCLVELPSNILEKFSGAAYYIGNLNDIVQEVLENFNQTIRIFGKYYIETVNRTR